MDLHSIQHNSEFNKKINEKLKILNKYKFFNSEFSEQHNYTLGIIKVRDNNTINEILLLVVGELNVNSPFDRKIKKRTSDLIKDYLFEYKNLQNLKYIWIWIIFKKEKFSVVTHGGARGTDYQKTFKAKVLEIYSGIKKRFSSFIIKVTAFTINAFIKNLRNFTLIFEENFNEIPINLLNWNTLFKGPIQYVDDDI